MLIHTLVAINAKGAAALLRVPCPELGEGADDVGAAILGQSPWNNLQSLACRPVRPLQAQ